MRQDVMLLDHPLGRRRKNRAVPMLVLLLVASTGCQLGALRTQAPQGLEDVAQSPSLQGSPARTTDWEPPIVRGQSPGGTPNPGIYPPATAAPYGSPSTNPSISSADTSSTPPLVVPPPPPASYDSTLVPGATQYAPTTVQPTPWIDPNLGITAPGVTGYQPRERVAPIDVWVQEARTGRIILGGSVNSDLGVAGQLIIDERNFDIRRIPRSWDDLWSGRAFRGAGQNFRLELMPGSQVERYTVTWSERNLFGYLPYSLSVGGFLYTRQYRDWSEQRLGGRIALGYEVTKDLSVSTELRLEDVKLFDPRIAGVPELDSALGSNDLYTARFRVAHDTRDSPFMSTEGGMLELVFDQVFGEYDYSRGNVSYSRYFLLRERPDGTGRHVLASTFRVGVTGAQTPIFENYFAGGYSTLRGFRFRGASPKVSDVQVGGEFLMLGSVEYVFPLTADEMLRGVAFVDYGTVERDIELNSENFRVSPGLGLRVSVPALGPAPLAFDFAYPVNRADTDETQVFSFFMGFTR
ncbi:MAG: membrane protein [Pirellulaceae bacterium]|nr:MAG: membrane protein [Pirellulaceae bacterium]